MIATLIAPGNEPITPKQKNLLASLIFERISDEAEREQWLSEMESLSKSDAYEMFSNLMSSQ